MAKPTVARAPWYKPSRIVWGLPWLGLAFALNVIVLVWLIILFVFPFEWEWLGTWTAIHGFLALFTFSYLINFVAVAMVITTAMLRFGSFIPKISARVASEYKSLSRSQVYLSIILWLSTAAIMIFLFIPTYPLIRMYQGLLISRYTYQVVNLIEIVFANFPSNDILSILSYGTVPMTISLGASISLSFALLAWLFMVTLRPSNVQLLKKISYSCALSLATVTPFGIFPYFIWFEGDFPFGSSHLVVFDLLAPVFLLLAVSLVWLYFQRARLAALGEPIKKRARLIAFGGIVLQVSYLVYWSVFAAPNLSADAEFFYVGSVLLAAFVAVAWLGLLLMVGARRKWDWALFGLVGATQIASLIVVYPGFLTA